MLNVYFGGSLEQNMRYHAQSKDRWEGGHDVYTVGTTRKEGKFEVNSHHHQAVLYSTLSKELDMLVYADNEEDSQDCIVEAFKHKTLPIVGIQWHPEEWRDGFSHSLIIDLLNKK